MSDPRESWEAQEPSPSFADDVLRRIAEQDAPPSRRRWVRPFVAGGALAVAAGVALVVGFGRAPDHGDVAVVRRTQVSIGGRAVAVLEPGAHLAWSGDRVTQTAGDVFYRVERGGPFHVLTAAGDVSVLGTCFRVRVDAEASRVESNREEHDVNGRDVKAGAVGAVLGAAAFVGVYEGKVAVSHASESVTLTAGESARSDATGVHRVEGAAAGGGEAAAAGAGAGDPLVTANANLADTVREYKRRLESIEGQKAAIAKQLADAQQKLAVAQNDGQAVAAKSPYDLDADDWKQLAKQGKVVARMACSKPDEWTIGPKTLAKLGLAPQDAQPIHDALEHSSSRIWTMLRPLCIQALQGSAEMADKLGPSTCQALVGDVARQHEDTGEETRLVAEMRGGVVPTDPSKLGSYGKMLYQMSGETKAIEQDLAQSIGPDDARRFTYGDEGSWCSSTWGAGPRAELPPGVEKVTGTSSEGN